MSSLVAQRLKRPPPMRETRVRSPGRGDPLEKEMVTHSSILAWRIPWTEGRKESDTTEWLHFLYQLSHKGSPRTLKWVAYAFCRRSPRPRNWTRVSRITGGFFSQLSHKGSPRTLEWVAYSFSRGSSWPRNRTGVSCTARRFFTNWAVRESHKGTCFLPASNAGSFAR